MQDILSQNETRNGQRVEVVDGREDLPIFIHSALDDYGLSAIEFRVYARLARRCGRGVAYESVVNMAKDFESSDRTIQRGLRLLVECRLISETIRPGKTTQYTLNGQNVWQDRSNLKATRERLFPRKPKPNVTGDTKAGGDTTPGGGVTPERGVVVTPRRDEGSPSEGSPLKVLPNTHTHAFVAPPARASSPPAQASGKPVCVCKLPHDSEFCDDARVTYARNQARFRDPVAVAMTKEARAGLYDEAVREFVARVENPASARAPRDTSACPDCHGSLWLYPQGRENGAAKCPHPRLNEELARLCSEVEANKRELTAAAPH